MPGAFFSSFRHLFVREMIFATFRAFSPAAPGILVMRVSARICALALFAAAPPASTLSSTLFAVTNAADAGMPMGGNAIAVAASAALAIGLFITLRT